jgi:hypothetical protein
MLTTQGAGFSIVFLVSGPLFDSIPARWRQQTQCAETFVHHCILIITVDSPEIGHAPDPDKPVAFRTSPISRPQCTFNSEFQIGQLSDSKTK